MTSRAGRVRGRRGAVLECLEDRALLSAASLAQPPAHVAAVSATVAAPKVVTLQGTLVGQAAPYSNPKLPAFNTSISAKGGTPVVTLAGLQAAGQKGATLLVSNGQATFKLSKFTTVTVTYSGSGNANPSKPTQTLTFSGKVTGGGGTFAGATGAFRRTMLRTNAVRSTRSARARRMQLELALHAEHPVGTVLLHVAQQALLALFHAGR